MLLLYGNGFSRQVQIVVCFPEILPAGTIADEVVVGVDVGASSISATGNGHAIGEGGNNSPVSVATAFCELAEQCA